MKHFTLCLVAFYLTAICRCQGSACERRLGMASRRLIKDDQITASSYYGTNFPRFARLNGNSSWCASIQNNEPMYLEVDLGKIMRLTKIAIQGYGERYVSNYTMEYKRQKKNRFWRTMIERLPDNTTKKWSFYGIHSNRSRIRYTRLKGPRIVRYVRIVPLEGVGKQWCLRLELFGCEWKQKDGLISYRSAQGNIRGANETEVVMKDATYDGAATFLGRRHGLLQGGLGQLTDGDIGGNAFWYNLANGKGFEWVGWFDVEIPKPSILFEFDAPRKFSKIFFHANNRPGNVKIFRNLLVAFSNDGQYFSQKFVFYPEASLRRKKNQSMWVEVDLDGHVGKYFNCEFTYEGKWIVLSEISFESVLNNEDSTEIHTEIHTTRLLDTDDVGTTPNTVKRSPNRQDTILSVPVIIAMATVGFLLVLFTIVLIFWLKKRHRRIDGRTRQQRNDVRIVNPIKDGFGKEKAQPCEDSSSESEKDTENLVTRKMNNFVPRHQPWYKSLDRHKMNNISTGIKTWKTKHAEDDDEEKLEKVNI